MKKTISDLLFEVKDNLFQVTKFYRASGMDCSVVIHSFDDDRDGFELLSASEMAEIALFTAPGDVVWDQNEAETAVGNFEVWSSDCTPPPLSLENAVDQSEWDSSISRIKLSKDPDLHKQLRTRIFAGSLEPTLRKTSWKYLLNVYPFKCTQSELDDIKLKNEAQYDQWKNQWKTNLMNSKPDDFINENLFRIGIIVYNM
jgi:hypothetical protein